MDRECNKCIHHTGGSCSSFECNMQTLEEHDKEVRAKAIEEYAERIRDWQKEIYQNGKYAGELDFLFKHIDEIAKELKGE